MTPKEKATFTDEKGRPWALRVTTLTAMRLRDELDVDVSEIVDEGNELLRELIEDTVLLVKILLVITRDARKAQDVSDEDFLDALGAEEATLDNASLAFLWGVVNILPKLKRRPMVALLERLETTIETASETIATKVTEETGKIGETIDEAISGAFSGG